MKYCYENIILLNLKYFLVNSQVIGKLEKLYLFMNNVEFYKGYFK